MSFVRRLLMVLLLAGPAGVLAWEDWYYKRNPCGHYCGGDRNVQCAVGCKCVLEDYENWGVCRRVPQCGGPCGGFSGTRCGDGCSCVDVLGVLSECYSSWPGAPQYMRYAQWLAGMFNRRRQLLNENKDLEISRGSDRDAWR
ncbi:uncharacterized protein LOC142591293 [Dermacentor variabilis]|uniref:uncharacterized protein LOC142591293 n=1 Tax=Dermacentor variabilis TaxID=34621 RepID=UPI003F5B0D80